MTARSAGLHARFFLRHLALGLSVLNLGCGPGSITVGLTTAVAPSTVTGLDSSSGQLATARRAADALGLDNLRFSEGSCYELDLPECSVDRVFAHALIEHLARPAAALREAYRVLRRGRPDRSLQP
jgi:ubiquinone/menaquinone biosynthesis C-methylase UbiE